METLRVDMIQATLNKIEPLPNRLLDHSLACFDTCNSLLLGSFMLRCHKITLSGTKFADLERPFPSLSFARLQSLLQGPYTSAHCTDIGHPCTLERFLESAFGAGEEVLDRSGEVPGAEGLTEQIMLDDGDFGLFEPELANFD